MAKNKQDGVFPTEYEFAGANTGSGFVSFYDRLFPEGELSALYIIKGGSGTGKSTFMRRVLAAAAGEGFAGRGYLCGSDESSLDGVMIVGCDGRRVGIIDGTPPHARELRCPGAAGDILDFGRFWDSAALRRRRSEIEALCRRKSSAFDTSYRYLGAAEKINRHIYRLWSGVFERTKAATAARRLVSQFDGAGSVTHTQLSGFTMNGEVRFGAYDPDVKLYPVTGDADAASMFIDEVLREAKTRGVAAYVSCSPLDLTHAESVYFPHDRAFVYRSDLQVPDRAEKVINTRRFIDRAAAGEVRQKIRFGKKCRTSLIDGGLESLADARECHFALEKIYGACMDFDALESEQALWIGRILAQLA